MDWYEGRNPAEVRDLDDVRAVDREAREFAARSVSELQSSRVITGFLA